MTLLNRSSQILLREPFESGLERCSSWVGVDDGRVDDEGMGDPDDGEVSVERVTDQDHLRGEKVQQASLNVAETSLDGIQQLLGDAGVADAPSVPTSRGESCSVRE